MNFVKLIIYMRCNSLAKAVKKKQSFLRAFRHMKIRLQLLSSVYTLERKRYGGILLTDMPLAIGHDQKAESATLYVAQSRSLDIYFNVMSIEDFGKRVLVNSDWVKRVLRPFLMRIYT